MVGEQFNTAVQKAKEIQVSAEAFPVILTQFENTYPGLSARKLLETTTASAASMTRCPDCYGRKLSRVIVLVIKVFLTQTELQKSAYFVHSC